MSGCNERNKQGFRIVENGEIKKRMIPDRQISKIAIFPYKKILEKKFNRMPDLKL